MKNIIVGAIIALIIGGAVGFFVGKNSEVSSVDAKKLQDVTTMMNQQSSSIKQMGEMMRTYGLSVQDMGMKYKDESLVASGKDLQAIAEKYLNENKTKSQESGMKQMMQ